MRLSKEQIASVRNRIQQEGIIAPDLQHDILDHLCCSIEREMSNAADFDSVFQQVFSEFSPEGGLSKIQVEINYLSNYKSLIMKKVTLLLAFLVSMLFFLSTFLIGLGLLNNYNWSFMEYLAFINQYAICLFLLPLYWFHQYKMADKEISDGLSSTSKTVMFLLGFLCSEALVNAAFFKIMHLRGGNQLFVITAVLGMSYVPFYLLRKYRLGVS